MCVWGEINNKKYIYIGKLACVRIARAWRYISLTSSSGACKCEKNKYKKIIIKKRKGEKTRVGDGYAGETK